MLNVKSLTLSLAVTAAITFVLCVLYGLIVPPAFHAGELLGKFLPGFHWISPLSFLLGLVESFIYGAYCGLLVGQLYNFFQRRGSVAR